MLVAFIAKELVASLLYTCEAKVLPVRPNADASKTLPDINVTAVAPLEIPKVALRALPELVCKLASAMLAGTVTVLSAVLVDTVGATKSTLEPVMLVPVKATLLLTTLPRAAALMMLLVTAICAVSASTVKTPMPYDEESLTLAVRSLVLKACKEDKPVLGRVRSVAAQLMLLLALLAVALAKDWLAFRVTDESVTLSVAALMLARVVAA